MNAHEKLTILVRDKRSLELSQRLFKAPSNLCPDMAFAGARCIAHNAQKLDILELTRQDNESLIADQVKSSFPRITDWDRDPDTLWRLSVALIGSSRWPPSSRHVAPELRPPVYDSIARRRLNRGLRMLNEARVVITDRLHGHILCLIQGIPHVVLDNSYGKLSTFYKTWTSENNLAHWADSYAQAVDMARLLAGKADTAHPKLSSET